MLDLGMTCAEQPHKFYETAARVAKAIQSGQVERGILMCGTGHGRLPGGQQVQGNLRRRRRIGHHRPAALGHQPGEHPLHGAWIVGPYVARDMVDAWLTAKIGEGFNEERRRVQAEGYARIQKIEAENFQ